MSLYADAIYSIPADVTEEEFGKYFEKTPDEYVWKYIPTENYLKALTKVLKQDIMKTYAEDEIFDMFKDHCIEVMHEYNGGWHLCDSGKQPSISLLYSPTLISELFPNAEIQFESYREADGGYCDYYKAVYKNGELLKVFEDKTAEEYLKEDLEEESQIKPLEEDIKKSNAYEIQDIETYHDAFMKYE